MPLTQQSAEPTSPSASRFSSVLSPINVQDPGLRARSQRGEDQQESLKSIARMSTSAQRPPSSAGPPFNSQPPIATDPTQQTAHPTAQSQTANQGAPEGVASRPHAGGDLAASSSSATPTNLTNAQANAALQSGPVPTVYLATYSNVPVYEITVRGIACMRRRGDGWLNATQILKIAGIDKTKRTKILEKSILTGEHEKIQGGYGKFQGTWIPLQRAQQLAADHSVAHLLRPLLEFDPATATSVPKLNQRKKPAASSRNASAAAAQEGRAVGVAASAQPTTSKQISPALGVAGGPSQQPRFLSLRPPREESREMSPALFMPPGGGGLISTYGPEVAGSAPSSIPPGSNQAQQDALRGYSSYGYTPQGVPLPPLADPDRVNGNQKRLQTGDDHISAEDVRGAKRARAASPEHTQANGQLLELSPVKDLNALGPAGGSLRAASAPKGNRATVGAANASGRDGSIPRYADRALIPKPYDEGERRMRDHLVSLFAEEESIKAGSHNGTPKTGAAAPSDVGASKESTEKAKEGSSSVDSSSDASKLDKLLQELREKASLGGVGGAGLEGPKPSVDLVTDDHGHTALHWASALCRLPLVRTLVARPPNEGGANVHAGNHAGETALHRSVLVTNSYDASSFPALLSLLSVSLNTRDFKRRTVLHHIALVAGLKGRAASARYYMACTLEHMANEKSGKYKGLIDAQDEEGETALGIVARLGNASMTRMLLDVGARKDLPNSLGIRPSDWGIDAADSIEAGASSSNVTSLPPSTAIELATQTPQDIIASLTRPTQGPVFKSQEVREQMTSALDELQQIFDKELKEKQDAVALVQAHLQAATRELAARRKDVAAAQARVAERDEAKQRVGNLRRALAEHLRTTMDDPTFEGRALRLIQDANGRRSKVDESDTLGKMDVDGDSPKKSETTRSIEEGTELPLTTIQDDLKISALSDDPIASQGEELVRLRWLVQWYQGSCDKLEEKISNLEGASAKKELQCQKVVAMCAHVPQNKVESVSPCGRSPLFLSVSFSLSFPPHERS
ncbi:hypothetical protein IE53DRAFT_385332 [Violaceomyces palustris]|uniref:Uncharacterized protein n=1 Tax=Violaceomyces palustris TaxID=1673888 RepID=A0ACD0P2B3_9BASI|nr:hypothetical protein IE53DRAFT_385332 [Violaceomyces palustris]